MLLLLPNCKFIPDRCSGGHSSACCGVSLHLFFLVLLSFPSLHWCCTQHERDSLLSFLSNLSSTPPAALPRWSVQDGTDCCKWEGIACNSNASITSVWLPLRGLTGNISPSLAGLTQLTQLNLSRNSLSGTLSPELLWSNSLTVIDVSFNRLSGELIPDVTTSIARNLQIRTLNVSSNLFNGTFPSLWGLAPDLTEVDGSNNSFSGTINSSICDVSHHIQALDFSHNQLSGDVPQGLGNCSELRVFRAGFNNLSGPLPRDLYDAVPLQHLSLPFNQISGTLDAQRMVRLTRLTVLDISGNRLRGELPEAIGKLINLERLLIYSNNLNGNLPMALGNCTKLKYLNLRENNLTGEISRINFSALSQLKTLDLGNNNFSGDLPESIYSCKSLIALRLAKNSLQGRISPGLVNLQSLSYLSLSCNDLKDVNGAFRILQGCKNLTTIVLSRSFKGENVPDGTLREDMNRFPNLQVLAIADCQLKGHVPSWLAFLGNLEVLDLSLNQLSGLVPGWLGNMSHLFYLDLSYNLLSGKFPVDLTALNALTSEKVAARLNQTFLELPVFVNFESSTLNLQYNQLSSLPPAIYLKHNSLDGSIPPEIGQLKVLHVLDLSSNNFSGDIPVELGKLTNLEMLNLSRNHLSGKMPQELNQLHFLSWFSVAYNSLWGLIPVGGQFNTFPDSSFEGNDGLCGLPLLIKCTKGVEAAHPSKSKHSNKTTLLIGIILSICFGGVFSLTLFISCILSKGRRNKPVAVETAEKADPYVTTSSNMIPSLPNENVDNDDSVVLFPGNCKLKNLTVSDILKGTDSFSQAQIIGCGGFGLVYKAILPDGNKLAIKRLSGDMGVMEREFKAEVEALSTANHKNLVSLQGYCMHAGFRLLIYSYMENGSLDYWLHERDDGRMMLSWPVRLRIAQGASQGLSYIHQICEPHIVHRDIKSSNILLDLDFEARVADFGLSRLMLPTDTHVTTELVGTLGYIPPEYGQAWAATLRGDIYSFGVVLLELLTGRRPLEVFKPKQSRELVGWVQQMRSHGKQDEVFDMLLREKGFEEQMLQMLEIACLCVNQNPLKRPTIKEVVDWLDIVGINQPANTK